MRSSCLLGIVVGCILVCAPRAWAAGGTSQVASKGHKVTAQESWPKGLAECLKHPSRTAGWNPWFTEWPNDVEHFQFVIKNTDEANEVLKLFAEIKADLHVHLALGEEPAGIGWVSKLEPGNDTALLLSCGDQNRMNEWYAQLGGRKFGVMEFERCPVAVPPTLTIFVQNKAIDLEALRIPGKIRVSAGHVPGAFHISNLKPSEKPAPPGKVLKAEDVDAATRTALEAIDKFLARRREAS